tara:strand:- start:20 stop:208 length:189 start_codon:yes stop_codon:yes gene_type:complete
MRYSYEVKPVEGDSKTLHAMSYKKFLRKLSTEFKEGETVKVSYKNKKNHDLVKYVKIKARAD